MTKGLPAGLVFLFLFAHETTSQAQGWMRHKKMLVARGLGLTHIVLLPQKSLPNTSASKIGLSFNISTEHKLARCLGIGVQTGLNIFFSNESASSVSTLLSNENKTTNKALEQTVSYAVPIGGRILFHLLEGLYVPRYCRYDVYIGIAVGAGPVFSSKEKMRWFAYGGPVTGVRYRFGKMSLFGEFGYGASLFNCGVVF